MVFRTCLVQSLFLCAAASEASPTLEVLSNACSGVGARSTNQCTVLRATDTKAKASACFAASPLDEDSYRSCVLKFCNLQSRVCTGHGGQYACRRECEHDGRSQYAGFKASADLPKKHDPASKPPSADATPSAAPPTTTTTTTTTTLGRVNASEADAVALSQHRAALRGRRFGMIPTDIELKEACSNAAPGRPTDACVTVRLRHTNGKAQKCFQRFSSNKAKYQACCTEFCQAQSKWCTGQGGSSMCFSQCVQNAHPLFTNLKALSGVPGAMADTPVEKHVAPMRKHPRAALAQKPSKVASKATWHHPMAADDDSVHDPADVARVHHARQ